MLATLANISLQSIRCDFLIKIMPQTVWIARHANRLDFVHPEWFNTAPKRYDPPLSSDGIFQAYRLGQRLKNEPIKYIFSSPFLRTIQTADRIAEALDLNIKIERGLSEWLNPQWMTKIPELNYSEFLDRKYPRLDRHYVSKILPQYPETELQMRQRTVETIKQLVTEYREDMLLIGHSASVEEAISGLIGGNIPIKVPLCSLFKIVGDRDIWQLEINGDTSHLK
jgi:broad specificity phosphatase PhoE